MDGNESEMVTIEEAAERTGYSKNYLRELCREGKVKCRKVATVWLVDPEDVIDYRLHRTWNRGDGDE